MKLGCGLDAFRSRGNSRNKYVKFLFRGTENNKKKASGSDIRIILGQSLQRADSAPLPDDRSQRCSFPGTELSQVRGVTFILPLKCPLSWYSKTSTSIVFLKTYWENATVREYTMESHYVPCYLTWPLTMSGILIFL